MPRASNRTSDDVYMWLEQESATRGTANCVTDFFLPRCGVYYCTEPRQLRISMCYRIKKATYVHGDVICESVL